MNQCEGAGAAHHDACDCREKEFSRLRAERDALQSQLAAIQTELEDVCVEKVKVKVPDAPPGTFEAEDGSLCVVRCPACNRENHATEVATGRCGWCGWVKR